MEKGNHPKVNKTQGFLTLGHSKGTICSLLSSFCSKNIHLFTQLPIINHFLIPQREKERREQGLKMEKGNHPKVNETQEFLTLGYSNLTICSLLSSFCSKIIPPFYPAPHNKQFLITPERGRKKGAGAENGKKGITPK